MAIYQGKYFLLPKTEKICLIEGISLKKYIENKLFEDDFFWANSKLKYSKIEEYLNKNFIPGKSWDNELKVFGNINSNSLEIFIEQDKISSISFRIDFRDDFELFLNKIVSFCKLYNLVIVNKRVDVLDCSFSEILKDILQSDDYKKYLQF